MTFEAAVFDKISLGLMSLAKLSLAVFKTVVNKAKYYFLLIEWLQNMVGHI